MKIDADFPGGNIIVEKVDGDRLYVRQDLRDTEGHWFYWYFRVREAAGRTLTVHFTGKDVIGTRGPAVSTDGGASWSWLGHKEEEPFFAYTVPAAASEVRFSVGIPYTEANFTAFLKRRLDHPNLKAGTLCTSRAGRPVERLEVGRLDDQPEYCLLLTARHHACEAAASYVLEGVLDAMLADDETGRWFRRHVTAFVVPFVDKDGVEAGDQGKNRSPRDHNRDYNGKSLYPEVAAIRQQVPRWWGETPSVVLDLHCPGLRGSHSQYVYMVGSIDEANWRQQQALGAHLQAAATGPLPYYEEDNLPYGQGWNTGGNYTKGRSNSAWARHQPQVQLATTLEFPYASVHGEPVTAAAARTFGRQVLQALCRYLQNDQEMRSR